MQPLGYRLDWSRCSAITRWRTSVFRTVGVVGMSGDGAVLPAWSSNPSLSSIGGNGARVSLHLKRGEAIPSSPCQIRRYRVTSASATFRFAVIE